MLLTREESHKKSKHSTLHEQELSQLCLQQHTDEHLHLPSNTKLMLNKLYRVIFYVEEKEGIIVFYTNKRSRASQCPTFWGGTKNGNFCPIEAWTLLLSCHVKWDLRN